MIGQKCSEHKTSSYQVFVLNYFFCAKQQHVQIEINTVSIILRFVNEKPQREINFSVNIPDLSM